MHEAVIQSILKDFAQHDKQKRAVDTLFQYLYFHLSEFGVYYGNEDIRSDFLLWIYPRLHNVIDGYNPQKSIFTTYLRMSITFQRKLFERRNRERATYTSIAQTDQQQRVKDILTEQDELHSYELYAASPQPKYSISPEKETAIQKTIKWKSKEKEIYTRYLLLLLCKSCFSIDEHLMYIVARRLEIPVQKIKKLIEETRRQIETRKTVYHELTTKRDYYYVRYKSATMQLSAVDSDHKYVIKRLKAQQAYSYKRWQSYLKKAKEYDLSPSNRLLAKQFGISRGTVDSDLAELKKTWYAASENPADRSAD